MQYFWEAVIEQLRTSDYVKIKNTRLQDSKVVAMLELTGKGNQWFDFKANESPPKFDFQQGARVVDIDTFYGNDYDDYDPEEKTSSEEEDSDDGDEIDGNDSDVIFVEQVEVEDVINISDDDDEDFEPTSKKTKISSHWAHALSDFFH